MVRLQPYRHPPNEVELLDYAQTLASFYADQSEGPVDRDARIRGDLRKLMIEELADAATCNRRNNTAKAHARGQVLLFAMTGFLLAFLAEAAILLSEALVA
ncbi:hypothetical protein [Sphingomonas sp. PAMC 26621]|uniref:hypothetical protein n=1 Tax=Sphingomonas sp. PAMC 26621 TaxID=1112213 RepID=UPI0002888184|nr:hypothetical protein [Sphingomonas sp. PAMC 26621]